MNKHNIALLTHGDSKMSEWKRRSTPNKRDYCNRHGYDFLLFEDRYSDRPPAWDKIVLLQQGLPKYDYILWSDPDSIILNKEFKIEDLIAEGISFRITFQGYYEGTMTEILPINAGVFLIKNSEFSMKFLQEIWDKEEYIHHRWWENMAIIDLMQNKYWKYPEIFLDCNATYNVLPRRYLAKDFILHFPGIYKAPEYVKLFNGIPI